MKDSGSNPLFINGAAPLSGSLGRPRLRPIDGLFVCVGILYVALFAYVAVAARILQPYSDMIDLVSNYFQAVDRQQPVQYLLQPHNLHRIVWLRGLVALDVGVFQGTGLPSVLVATASLAGAAVLVL